MKKSLIYLACGMFVAFAMSACNDSDQNGASTVEEQKEDALKIVMNSYVNKAVIPTYKGMADEGIKLAESVNEILEARKAGDTDDTELVKVAAENWKSMRQYWEQSEAWLYGPADFLGVDPHIDSWPFNQGLFDEIIADKAKMEKYEEYLKTNTEPEVGAEEDPYGTLGFHALEYVIFNEETSEVWPINHWTVEQWFYMNLVAQDLRNQAILLEAAWAGLDNISKEKQGYISNLTDQLEQIKERGAYGDYLINPAEGRVYGSYSDAAAELIGGCIDIANEVSVLKIGNACTGEDENYIESRYSWRSKFDFYDNIISVKKAYEGVDNDAAVHNWLNSTNKEIDENVVKQIEVALAAIDAMEEPFFKTATSEASQKAMEETAKLRDNLQVAYKALTGLDFEFDDEDEDEE